MSLGLQALLAVFPIVLAAVLLIGFRVAILHVIAGTLIPLFVVATMTGFFGKNRSFREGLEVWPFALFSALAMNIPYLLVAWLLGPEFPSLLGGLIGLAIVVPAVPPPRIRRFFIFASQFYYRLSRIV